MKFVEAGGRNPLIKTAPRYEFSNSYMITINGILGNHHYDEVEQTYHSQFMILCLPSSQPHLVSTLLSNFSSASLFITFSSHGMFLHTSAPTVHSRMFTYVTYQYFTVTRILYISDWSFLLRITLTESQHVGVWKYWLYNYILLYCAFCWLLYRTLPLNARKWTPYSTIRMWFTRLTLRKPLLRTFTRPLNWALFSRDVIIVRSLLCKPTALSNTAMVLLAQALHGFHYM